MKAEEVGYRIAQARKKQGMTQRELSERLHVSDKAVSKWERGVNYPDISLFDEIAKTLDLSLVELLGIEVPGAGILCTSGMMCFTGLMIANGLYTIIHAKKLYKNNSITKTTAQHATDT